MVHFDTMFSRQCDPEVVLSTAPEAETTHWKQAVFPLPEPLPVEAVGDVLTGRWQFRRHAAHPREWRVAIHLHALGDRRLDRKLEFLFN